MKKRIPEHVTGEGPLPEAETSEMNRWDGCAEWGSQAVRRLLSAFEAAASRAFEPGTPALLHTHGF